MDSNHRLGERPRVLHHLNYVPLSLSRCSCPSDPLDEFGGQQEGRHGDREKAKVGGVGHDSAIPASASAISTSTQMNSSMMAEPSPITTGGSYS